MLKKIVPRKSNGLAFGAMRLSSTETVKAPTPEEHKAADKQYVVNRRDYKGQMTQLRKEWQERIAAEKRAAEEAAALKRQQIIRERAVRLRIKREEARIRQEAHRRRIEAALLRYREHLESESLIRNEKRAAQQKRYEAMDADMAEESKVWLTMENMDSIITPEFFDNPTTTGIKTKYSEWWRAEPITLNMKRTMSPERMWDYGGKPDHQGRVNPQDYLKAKMSLKFDKKLMAMQFLDEVIATGHEKENYKKLVEDYVEVIESKGEAADIDAYFEHLRETAIMHEASYRNYAAYCKKYGLTEEDYLEEDFKPEEYEHMVDFTNERMSVGYEDMEEEDDSDALAATEALLKGDYADLKSKSKKGGYRYVDPKAEPYDDSLEYPFSFRERYMQDAVLDTSNRASIEKAIQEEEEEEGRKAVDVPTRDGFKEGVLASLIKSSKSKKVQKDGFDWDASADGELGKGDEWRDDAIEATLDEAEAERPKGVAGQALGKDWNKHRSGGKGKGKKRK
jgi:hypothetical protein